MRLLRILFQSVKIAPNRQNEAMTVSGFFVFYTKANMWYHLTFTPRKACKATVLTCCANRTTNVPMYAYAFGLLAFGAPLTSVSLSKGSFLTG